MFNSNNGYSLADVAAVTNKNDGLFGDGFGGGAWWIVILFLFAFGGFGGNGWFGNGYGFNGAAAQGALTRADLNQEMGFSDLQSTMRSTRVDLSNDYHDLSTNILQNVCDLNGTINAVGNSITGGIANLGYQIQSGLNDVNVNGMRNTFDIGTQITALGNQMSSCCCDMRYQVEKGFSDTNYNLATQTNAIQQSICNQTRDIVDNQNANTRAILDRLTNDKISALESENQGLRLAASQAAQNQYLVDALRPSPIPAYNVPAPFPGCGCYANNYNFN